MREIKKYYSDILNKEFDSVEELNKAEEEKAQADKALTETSNHKKELANNIESAYGKIESAKKEYYDIRNKFNKDFKELNNEYNKKLDALKKERDELLSEKLKEIRRYSDERYTALCDYNKQFGAYKKYLTDKEADNEWRKITNAIFEIPNLWDMFVNW